MKENVGFLHDWFTTLYSLSNTESIEISRKKSSKSILSVCLFLFCLFLFEHYIRTFSTGSEVKKSKGISFTFPSFLCKSEVQAIFSSVPFSDSLDSIQYNKLHENSLPGSSHVDIGSLSTLVLCRHWFFAWYNLTCIHVF